MNPEKWRFERDSCMVCSMDELSVDHLRNGVKRFPDWLLSQRAVQEANRNVDVTDGDVVLRSRGLFVLTVHPTAFDLLSIMKFTCIDLGRSDNFCSGHIHHLNLQLKHTGSVGKKHVVTGFDPSKIRTLILEIKSASPLHLVGSTWCNLLQTAQTKHHDRLRRNSVDALQPSPEGKTTALIRDTAR
ncbi:hypothetical protein NPIL_391261 [Nephila pilipes]|uniref:Uncharacterized protein n=1 Tax=Nephila pilipes TaxID=299642 RepID=A0A8X6TPZ6_NEPPI|nr:hypothetical protein NPIL_391261 [Nephila pilipes]